MRFSLLWAWYWWHGGRYLTKRCKATSYLVHVFAQSLRSYFAQKRAQGKPRLIAALYVLERRDRLKSFAFLAPLSIVATTAWAVFTDFMPVMFLLLTLSLIGAFVRLKNRENEAWLNRLNASIFVSVIVSAALVIYGQQYV